MAKLDFITDLLKSLKQQYQDVTTDAVTFFAKFGSVHEVYIKETQRLNETNSQLKTISLYKAKNGVYPKIKGHENTELYIKELNRIQSRAEHELDKVEPIVIEGSIKRRALIGKIIKPMMKMLMTDRDASQFIATMMLRAPMPNSRARCETNEINKPLYIAALTVSLLRRLMDRKALDEQFAYDLFPSLTATESHSGIEYDAEQLERFEQYVLTPIITAVLIHNIGTYSADASNIYDGNRYRVLDEDQRKLLIQSIHANTLNYLSLGLGQPNPEQLSEEEYQLELQAFQLCRDIIENYADASHPRGNLLRIPMIYASFILSTKPKHDYLISFKAFDILKTGIDKGIVYKPYAAEFLRMVGLYPLGSGIFFISKESHVPERAVVTGLNPPEPSSAIVKQLTRKQVKFDDHTQVCASKNTIISNRDARASSEFDASYFKKQFPNGYFWNPSEVWERDLDHKQFWRRDNNLKKN